MITIVETLQFIKKAESLMDSDERQALVVQIAHNPEAGDIIPRTGGVRKLRVAGKGRGKNEKANLTGVEEKALYKVVQAIKKEMKS